MPRFTLVFERGVGFVALEWWYEALSRRGKPVSYHVQLFFCNDPCNLYLGKFLYTNLSTKWIAFVGNRDGQSEAVQVHEKAKRCKQTTSDCEELHLVPNHLARNSYTG